MARKPKQPEAGPSKAYLVSFGDTMTALLAFFIVLNSLSKEQTGANMYAGTGSFVNAFSRSGLPGQLPGNRSSDMIQQREHQPIYALKENLDRNTVGNVGPDDTEDKDRILDRDKENFQKFLTEIEHRFGLNSSAPISNIVAFDSFASLKPDTSAPLSEHALQLASETIPRLHRPKVELEIVIWATMPAQAVIDNSLETSLTVRNQIENAFWLTTGERQRIKYSVKPWLFSDAKRPVISFVIKESS
ncbi:MAG: flagellar motor protein MotB [Planctomycetota bacterium]